jgi:hypothetical protein
MVCCTLCFFCRKGSPFWLLMMVVIAWLCCNEPVQQYNNKITDFFSPLPQMDLEISRFWASIHESNYSWASIHESCIKLHESWITHFHAQVLRLCFNTILTFLEGWLLVIGPKKLLRPFPGFIVNVTLFMYIALNIYQQYRSWKNSIDLFDLIIKQNS